MNATYVPLVFILWCTDSAKVKESPNWLHCNSLHTIDTVSNMLTWKSLIQKQRNLSQSICLLIPTSRSLIWMQNCTWNLVSLNREIRVIFWAELTWIQIQTVDLQNHNTSICLDKPQFLVVNGRSFYDLKSPWGLCIQFCIQNLISIWKWSIFHRIV